jgi:hypothetical protein
MGRCYHNHRHRLSLCLLFPLLPLLERSVTFHYHHRLYHLYLSNRSMRNHHRHRHQL